MRTYRFVVAALSLVLGVGPVGAAPASAAATPTRVSAAVDLPTVHVGSTLIVNGKVTPGGAHVTVTLQRLVRHTWKTVARRKSGAAGTFAFALAAPRKPQALTLRTLAGTRTSATLHVRVVTAAFAVTATAALTGAQGHVVVTGAVRPRTAGRVRLQRLTGTAWVTVGTAPVGRTGTFTVATTLARAGSYTLRVLRPWTVTTAQGWSPRLHVTVTAPVPDPQVTTTTLPAAVVGRSYSAVLAGTSGVGPYTWSVTGLPAGLAVSGDTISGSTVLPGLFPLTVTVRDSGGRTGAATLALTVRQTHVMSWGYNASGQLGNGTTTSTTTAAVEPGIDGVTAIAATPATVLLLRDDGTVWCQGYADGGACGLGPVTSADAPQPVPGLTTAVAVAAGAENTYVLTADGTVWASGPNAQGQLGNGSTTPSRVFAPVLGLGRAVAIAAGQRAAYAVLADGSLWAWGDNSAGELGTGTTTPSLTPVQVPGLTGVKAVAADYLSAAALLTDGTVRTWGRGTEGQLGNGSSASSPTPVVVAGLAGITALTSNVTTRSVYAVRSDGTLWAWGDNTEGQLGDGTTVNRSTPVPVTGLTGVVQVSAGSALGLAVLADGTLDVWGEGASGSLGDGNASDHVRTVPAPVPGVTGAVAAAGGEAFGVAVVAG